MTYEADERKQMKIPNVFKENQMLLKITKSSFRIYFSFSV